MNNFSLEIEKPSILAWIRGAKLKDEAGTPLDYSDRLFWLDILADWSNEIVIKGAAQVGKSVNFSAKVIYALKYLGLPTIYTFPTDDDVREFVASKMNKIIDANRDAIGTMDSENIERKEIAGVFAHFKGLKSDTASIATTARLVIHDEASRSSQIAMQTMESRMKAVPAHKRYRWMFSNPTIERDTLDLVWQMSDKKEWFVTCRACKVAQPLTFADNITVPEASKNEPYFSCKECKAVLPDEARRKGEWRGLLDGQYIPWSELRKKPDRNKISGWHISHLMCAWISAKEIVRDSALDPEYFHNFVLGEPYSPSLFQVTRSLILDAWTAKDFKKPPYFLGVDVGSMKHYCLGNKDGVFKVGRFSSWNELDEIIAKYDPFMVIDAMPENEVSRAYVSRNPKASMCYLGGKDKESNLIVRFGKDLERGVIKADRNRLIDRTISKLQEGLVAFNLPADADYRRLIAHAETLRRVKVKNNDGIERYVWESTTGEDHLFFALMFYDIAREASDPFGVFLDAPTSRQEPIIQTMDGFKMNLPEFMRYPEE